MFRRPVRDDLSSDLASLKIDRGPRPARRSPRWILWLAVPAALILLGYFVVTPYVASKMFKREVQVTEVVEARPGQAKEVLVSTGYIKPQRVSQVAAEVTGKVIEVKARQGADVKLGDVLLVLDVTDVKAAIAAAQAKVAAAMARAASARANLSEIKLQAERARTLAEKGVRPEAAAEDLAARVTALQQQVRAADAEVRAAQAEVKTMEIGLGNYTVKAPIGGRIISEVPEVGEMVGPVTGGVSADAIIEIADFTTLVMETDVPESRMDRLRRDDGRPVPAEITLDAFSSKRYPGRISEIVPKVNRTKATVTVKVAFDGAEPPAGVLPDMAGRVRFLSEELDQATMNQAARKLVAESAIVERGGQKVVFVVDDGKVRMKAVAASGPENGFYVLDGDGPSVGTKVVKAPPDDLTDGEKVKERTDG